MLTYISLFIAFAGSLIGVVSGNWDKNKLGLLKLSNLGWIAFFLSFLGFTSSLALTVKAEHEKVFDEKQRQAVRAIASGQVADLCKRMAAPFLDMRIAIHGTTDSRNLGSTELKAFASKANRKTLRSLNLAIAPREDTGFELWNESYLEFLHATFVERAYHRQLWQVVLTWTPYLDAEMIVLAERIRTHHYLNTLESIRPYASAKSKAEWKRIVGVSYAYDGDSSDDLLEEHDEFLLAVAQLWELASKRRDEAKAP